MTAGPGERPLRVCHVSPTYFSPESAIGGGERFVEELARAMAAEPGVEVRLVSFGPRSSRERPVPGLERVILRSWTRRLMTPFAPGLVPALAGADVVHCHQYYVLPTFLAALQGRLQGSRVFVTDLGGGGWTPAYQIDQSRFLDGHLPLSEYAAGALPGRRRRPATIIYGGVDLDRYPPRPAPEHDGRILFLGRLLEHKGIHHLIEALPPGRALDLVGPAGDPAYRKRLESLADGKEVTFHGALPDEAVIERLGRAMALVHPTPVGADGSAGAHELLGLAPVEAMARGCPVVATRAASLPEVVADGISGLLVPPNDPPAITAAIQRLSVDSDLWRELSRGARRRVEERFTWRATALRCLLAYRSAGAGSRRR